MPLNPNDVSHLLRGLRQRRTFTDQPIPDDVLHDILEVARWTGSSKNTQPWDFVVVQDRDTLRQLSEAGDFAGFLAGVRVAIVLAMHPGATPYDEGRASERIMLIAAAHGLGSGTGWFRGGAEGDGRVRELLGIPEGYGVRSAVGLGYPDAAAPTGPAARGRKPLSELVSYERFGDHSGHD